MLPETTRLLLLGLARRSVAARVTGGVRSRFSDPAAHGSENRDLTPLPSASGVFVTLKIAGQLRGCLGTLECRDLAADVVRCAADAASEDPRFPPVTTTELPAVTIDVSVLGPLTCIDPHNGDAIVIGRDGLVVEQGTRRGLLLPQVAAERGWNREQFLDHTCVKAGFQRDAWRHGATVYRFSAEVFGE